VPEEGLGRLRGRHLPLQHHAGQHLLLAQLVLDRHHRRLRHLGMGEQHRLHLGGGNILAGAADDVLLAVDEVQHAVGSARDDVAGVEPPLPPGRLRRRRIVEIAREAAPARRCRRMAHQHLAGLAVRHIAVVLVDDPHLDARHGAAEGARAHLSGRDAIGQHTHHLGHAPQLDQRKTEALLEGRVQLRLDAGAEAEAHTMPAVLGAGRLAQQQRRDDAQVMHDGGPRLGDLAPPHMRMKAIGLDLAIARYDGAHQRHHAGVGVIERQRIVDAFLALAHRRQPADGGIPEPYRDLVAMREDAALGPPRGA
jgi:hypothetical protein